MEDQMKLPEGTKVKESAVLRKFAANIEHAAKLGTPAAAPYRKAYDDAIRRAREAELAGR
jgi:hypothetical protein